MYEDKKHNGQDESDEQQLDEIERRVREIREVISGAVESDVAQDLDQGNGSQRPAPQDAAECNEMQRPLEPDATECNEMQQSDASKCNEMQRNAAISENGVRSFYSELPPRQQTAIRRLIDGMSITDVAAELSVNRTTVSRWLNRSYPFEMALREKLREVWGETNVGMAAHARKAIDRLAALLDANSAEYRFKSAKSILALTPLARNRGVTGPYMP